MKYVMLVLIAVIWGSQFILNDNALFVISPFELAFYRVLFGWTALSIIIRFFSKEKTKIKWTKDLIILLILLTLFESVIPLVLNGYGQMQVSSSVTAILMASIPLVTIVLESIINKRTIKFIEFIGIVVGIVGLICLVYPDLILTQKIHYTSVVFILIGAFCFALALIIITRIPREVPSLRFTRAVLLISSISLLPLMLKDQHFRSIDTGLWGELILLGSLSSGIVYYLYLFLVRSSGAVFTSLTNFIVPVVGVGLGVFFNDDSFTSIQYIGFVVILAGLLLVNIPNFKRI